MRVETPSGTRPAVDSRARPAARSLRQPGRAERPVAGPVRDARTCGETAIEAMAHPGPGAGTGQHRSAAAATRESGIRIGRSASRVTALLGVVAVLAYAPAADAASTGIGASDAPSRLPQAATRLGACPPGQVAYRDGTSLAVKCVPLPDCGAEQTRNADGKCVCPPGKIAVRHGAEPHSAQCVTAPPCGPGQIRDAQTGECRCPPGQLIYRSGGGGPPKCIAAKPCPPGIKLDAVSGKCQCPAGTRVYWDGAGGGGCAP